QDEHERQAWMPLLRMTQRLRRRDLSRLREVDCGNARLRALAEETVQRGWWQLLWIPPSLPYYKPGGVYANPEFTHVTKRLIFSSWVAAPTAIASLLSYAAERAILRATG